MPPLQLGVLQEELGTKEREGRRRIRRARECIGNNIVDPRHMLHIQAGRKPLEEIAINGNKTTSPMRTGSGMLCPTLGSSVVREGFKDRKDRET